MKADSSRRLLGHRQKSLYRWTVVALLLTIATHVFAAELSKEEKQKRLEAFREHAQSYQMQLTTDPPTPLKLNPKPLFSWHTARVNLVQQGFVFAWENQGRPEILATIFSHEPAGKPIELLQEMHSLSNSPLTAVKDQQNLLGSEDRWCRAQGGTGGRTRRCESGTPTSTDAQDLAEVQRTQYQLPKSEVSAAIAAAAHSSDGERPSVCTRWRGVLSDVRFRHGP